MLTNIDQGDLREHGRREDFFQEVGTRGFFQIFVGEAKRGKICLFPLVTKKTTFFAKIFKIQAVQGPPCPLPLRRPCTRTQHGQHP